MEYLQADNAQQPRPLALSTAKPGPDWCVVGYHLNGPTSGGLGRGVFPFMNYTIGANALTVEEVNRLVLPEVPTAKFAPQPQIVLTHQDRKVFLPLEENPGDYTFLFATISSNPNGNGHQWQAAAFLNKEGRFCLFNSTNDPCASLQSLKPTHSPGWRTIKNALDLPHAFWELLKQCPTKFADLLAERLPAVGGGGATD